jgi:hypothetical protein
MMNDEGKEGKDNFQCSIVNNQCFSIIIPLVFLGALVPWWQLMNGCMVAWLHG